MAVGKALQSVPTALARNPLIVALFAVFGLVQSVQVVTQQLSPIVGLALSALTILLYVLGMPFVQGGLIAMADESLRGRTTLGTFLRAGKSNYLSLFGATLIVFLVNALIGIAVVAAVLTGAVSLAAVESGSGLLVAGAVALLAAVLYLAFSFFVQFYGQEIVLNDASAVAGLKGSASLVRRNLLSAAGYLVVSFVGGGALGAVIGVASTLLLPQPSLHGTLNQAAVPGLVGYIVVTVLVTALLGSILLVFSVAFYREIHGGRSRTSEAAGV
ncbi:DUF7847 domain-containing protein [Halopelagius longus]|uniref:DUF7847 domain-containing protein n=1 Tax=Halopelagius longus TaxID=1236180 RepID=A0A1H1G6B3_9EURY|nr:hypothetical protein [Halopelagius longus]RDI69814.1 hypothetical protein DWB78_16825 [Halopelagius longus]SDR08792.1 hypothetical protein SAMN05216278_3552 [Halopelagius longus]